MTAALNATYPRLATSRFFHGVFFPRQGSGRIRAASCLAIRMASICGADFTFVVWTLRLWQDTKLSGNCPDAFSFKPAHGFLCFARFPALTQGGAPNAHEIVRRQPRLLGHQ